MLTVPSSARFTSSMLACFIVVAPMLLDVVSAQAAPRPVLRAILRARAAEARAQSVGAGTPQSSAAQPAPQPGQQPGVPPLPGGGPPVPSGDLTPGELNRLFEAYAVLQAQNMLRLTDDQYADFIVRLRTLQNVRRRHQQTRQRLLSDLRKMTNPQNPTGDEVSIRTTLEALMRADATAHDEILKAQEQVDELLDIRQRARFRVFEENLERWKLDLLSRVRRPNANRPNAVRPPKS